MAISTMYPAMPGSPKTTLTAQIAANATSMTLDDASVLPAAPNICVLGDSANAEIVSYTSIASNTVSGLVRGLGGTTASVWPSATVVARNFTSFDHDRFKSNIEAIAGEINDVVAAEFDASASYSIGDYVIKEGVLYRFTAAHTGAWSAGDVTAVTVSSELKAKANTTALSSYAPLASPSLTGTPTAPTASSGDKSTKIATTAYVQNELASEIMYFTGTAQPGNNTELFRIENAAITTDTVLLDIQFSNVRLITSDITWTSYSGYMAFVGSATVSTNVYVSLGQKGN